MRGYVFRQGSVALVAAVLTACGSKGGQTSQVIAKVDDSEITVSQLSEALAARGPTGAAPEATRQAVESLVNEQLLVKSALDNKLDRDPAVVQALERTRRQVLARAYAERMVFPRTEVSAAEQIEYYKQHPALFEKRRVFQMMVYTVKANELPAPVRSELAVARSADEVQKLLTAHGLTFDAQSVNRGTEQLPLGDLTKFEQAKVGDVVIVPPQQGTVTVMQILGIQDSPVSVDRAQPIIQQYLVNSRNAKALEEHLKQARTTAKIAYFDAVAEQASAQLSGQLQTAEVTKPAVSLN